MASAPPAPPPVPGADYVGHLGSGGFADVFVYRQHVPDRNVAVKVPRIAKDLDLAAQFSAEVNLMARMSAHPAVLSVFGVGTFDDGRQYLVMEYCPPPSLSQRCRDKPLPVWEVLDKGIRLAGAVASLHRVGIVHRDIKPANVLLTEFGLPVLSDFGLAATMSPDSLNSSKGFSIPWSPPEQQRGATVLDPTADVYSLAATLHTMLTGRPPFEIPGGDNSEFAMTLRVMRVPVPRTGRSDVPRSLEKVLAKAMAKDPAQRYSSAVEFARTLQQIQVDLGYRLTPMDFLEAMGGRPRPIQPSKSQQLPPAPQEPLGHVISETQMSPAPTGGIPAPPPIGDVPEAELFPPTKVSRVILIEDDPGPLRHAPSYQVEPGEDGAITQKTPGNNGQVASAQQEKEEEPTPAPQESTPGVPADTQTLYEEPPPRPRKGHFLIVVLVGLALVAVIAVAAFLIRPTAPAEPPSGSPSAPQTPPEAPVTSLPKVTGLTGTIDEDGVRFTWDSAGQDYSYLYRVVDPVNPGKVRSTSDTFVVVEAVEGRTCLEVAVRADSGASSTPVTECVTTP